tara:strand:+ start:2537 stop:3028 length:492 start_codon:yes stop_codon:yes gene_type:complete
MNIPIKYLPKKLTKKDRKILKKELNKSRKGYKKGKYIKRKKVKSFKSKKSQHILNAERIYKIKNLRVNKELVRKTGCSLKSLNAIIKKGQGAYYSSGSRPNQTPHSWGYARLGSAISGGKAASVDFNILNNGCIKKSKALRLAKNARKKFGYGTRKVPKTKLY